MVTNCIGYKVMCGEGRKILKNSSGENERYFRNASSMSERMGKGKGVYGVWVVSRHGMSVTITKKPNTFILGFLFITSCDSK